MTSRLFALAFLGLTSLPTASPASAQTDTDRYVACVTQMQPAQVRELLQAGSAEEATRPYQLLSADSRCFGKVFGSKDYRPEDASFPIDILRGRLAERALVNAGQQVAALPPLPLQQKRYMRPWFAATGRNAAVDEMGACVADTDPAGVAALLKTGWVSNEESAAIGALAPALTKCLSAGTRLNANRASLRAALADALYQRLNNPALSMVDVKGTPH